MAVKITLTVEVTTSNGRGDGTLQTLTEVYDLLTQPADWYAAPVIEQKLAEGGGKLVQQVAKLHGDIRDERPDAVQNSTLRARPLTAAAVDA